MSKLRWSACIAAALCFFSTQAALAQDSVVRIEEDWELQVTQPDAQLDAPQITTTMVPFGSQTDLLLQVDLNHGTVPAFSKGGIQVRACIEEECLDQARVLSDVRLHHNSETVQWTQVVQLTSNGFYFGIINGSSESWGDFGGTSTAIFVAYSSVGGNFSLHNYSPQHSLENSGVTYASNRVGKLRLKKIRVHHSNGHVSEYSLNGDVL